MADKYTISDLKDWLRELGGKIDPALDNKEMRHHLLMIHQTYQALNTLEDFRYRIDWLLTMDMRDKK